MEIKGELQAVGEFSTTGKLQVSDPCYERDTWCKAEIDVLPGTWRTFLTIETETGGWGPRVSNLIALHESCDLYTIDKLPFVHHEALIGVDSGQCGFFDDAHYRNDADANGYKAPVSEYWENKEGDDWYQMICDRNDNAMIVPGGVVSNSGYGDGGYDLYTARRNDEILAAVIVYIGPDTDDDEGDEGDEDCEE